MTFWLKEQHFPKEWKRVRVVLLLKGNNKYGTIWLISATGKLMEYMLKVRLEMEIEKKGSLFENKFDFRKGRLTGDAITRVIEVVDDNRYKWGCIIALDEHNVVNTAVWSKIIARLK